VLVGVVYGFATREAHVLHSHYMAVHPEYRGGGLGEQLKRSQAQWCLANGYTAMRWTFDPLQLTNAHLNLNKLGAIGVAYRENLYGTLGGINGSLPSDRLVVLWDLVGERPVFVESAVVEVPSVTPQDIAESAPEAIAARMAVREFMVPHLGDGWRVTAVDRHVRTYTLSR